MFRFPVIDSAILETDTIPYHHPIFLKTVSFPEWLNNGFKSNSTFRFRHSTMQRPKAMPVDQGTDKLPAETRVVHRLTRKLERGPSQAATDDLARIPG